MENFEILTSINHAKTWKSIKSDLPGTFPSGGFSKSDKLLGFYCKENGANIDLAMITSSNNGNTWSEPSTIIEEIDEAATGFEADDYGGIKVSYFKDDKAYSIYSANNGNSFQDPIETKEPV